MKRIIILLVYTLYLSLWLHSQVHCTIDTLIIEQVKNRSIYKIGSEYDEGPKCGFRCTIHNNSNNDSLILFPNIAKIEIIFNSNEFKNNSIEVFPLAFIENRKIVIPPNKSYKFVIGTNIFLSTQLFNPYKNDYTYEVFQILPSLKVKYFDSTNLIISDEISYIKINDY